jgi:hypothetical protein
MQRPHLTAKVFRYLRTLIDKAAINRGVHQDLIFLIKNISYPADIGQTSHSILWYFIFAKCFVLIKQSYNTILCFLLLIWYLFINNNGPPYSEVTVVSLPSSLRIVSSNAFVYSTCLLVIVFRYGLLILL